MRGFDDELERGATKRALFRMYALALGIPICSILIVLAYSSLTDSSFSRSDWKTFALVAWLGTLAALALEAVGVFHFRPRRAERPEIERREIERPERASRLSSWEGRKSTKLCLELLLALILLPSIAIGLVTSYHRATGSALSDQQLQYAVIAALVGTFIALLYLTLRGRKHRLIYK